MKLTLLKAICLWMFLGVATAFAQPAFQFNPLSGVPAGFDPVANGQDYVIDNIDAIFIDLQTPNVPARFFVDLPSGIDELTISVDVDPWGQITEDSIFPDPPLGFNDVTLDNSLSSVSVATISDGFISQGVYFEIMHSGEFTLQTSTDLLGDFDDDGDVDADDIDLLQEEVHFGSNDTFFDLTGDSLVNSADTDEHVHNILNSEYGDANLDLMVNKTDFAILLGSYGKTSGAGWASGEFTGEGNVGLDDLLLAKLNFGFGVPPAPVANSTVVPEPKTSLLLLIGLLAIGSLKFRNVQRRSQSIITTN